MFCSINNPSNHQLDSIRNFVLDKESVGIDKTKFKLCMYFTKSTLMKQAGQSVLLKFTGSEVKSMEMSEITAYPFGFILYFDPTKTWEYRGTDITACADVNYDVKINATMPWRIEEMNDIFPEHFRSKEEIEKCVEENKKWSDNNNE